MLTTGLDQLMMFPDLQVFQTISSGSPTSQSHS